MLLLRRGLREGRELAARISRACKYLLPVACISHGASRLLGTGPTFVGAPRWDLKMGWSTSL